MVRCAVWLPSDSLFQKNAASYDGGALNCQRSLLDLDG
jgi:predicted outer membrane repeat protein